MKTNKRFILSFVAPFMILISSMGLISKDNKRKIFYLPIGLMGIVIIFEKDIKRKLERKNKSFINIHLPIALIFSLFNFTMDSVCLLYTSQSPRD